MSQVSGINMGDAPQVGSVGFPGPAGTNGFAITGPWNMTPSAVSCAYPLDGDATVPAMFGQGWAGPAAGQELSYTRVGGASGDRVLLLPGDPLGIDAFSLPATEVSVELHITAAGGYPVGLGVLQSNGGAFSGVSLGAQSAADGDVVTVTVSAGGVISWKLNGEAQPGMGWGAVPAGHKWTPLIYTADADGSGGTVAQAALITAASDMLYGTGNDLCGNAIAGSATLPTGAAAGDCYEVTVAGSYGGTDYVVGDLAVVRSNGTSMTRIPAAGMTAAEIAAAIAAGVSEAEFYAVQRGNHTGTQAISTVDGLQGALDLKLDASAYVQHFLGKYASEGALSTAHPTALTGDYAIVDAGAGSAARQYVWDEEAGWLDSGDVKSGTTSDQLAEGSTNLFFTAARVRDTLLTGLSLASSAIISATDTVLAALGKLQAQITAAMAYIDAHVASTNNPHGVTLGQLVSTYTWAGKPSAATIGAGNEVFISDVGVNGSRWRSDGADYHPVNGNVVLALTAMPRGIAPSGTINVGSSDTITLGTALPRIYSKGIWLHLPAIATTPAIAAGMYYCVMRTTTLGDIYSSGPGSAVIAFSAGSSYAGVVSTEIELGNVPVKGGIMSAAGQIRALSLWGWNNSAGTKTYRVKFGGSGGTAYYGSSATSTVSGQIFTQIRNRDVDAQIGFTATGQFGVVNGANVSSVINTAADTSLSFTGSMNTATDFMILESVGAELQS